MFHPLPVTPEPSHTPLPAQAPVRARRNGITVAWARHADEVRQAQRLRYEVFADELGARLSTLLPGHDIDRFDDYCEHLLVRDAASQEVVGTYRLLTPAQALRAGGTYSDGEFDLSRLDALRPRMVELGRSCVHRDHRHGGVILALWSALAQFMARNELDTMIGCASIPMRGNAAAADVWHALRRTHLADARYRVTPHLPLPVGDGPVLPDAQPPALIRGYLRLGAKVLGPPAWDADFHTADLAMMMRMADLPPRYLRSTRGA